jgi:hypothetical protein
MTTTAALVTSQSPCIQGLEAQAIATVTNHFFALEKLTNKDKTATAYLVLAASIQCQIAMLAAKNTQ